MNEQNWITATINVNLIYSELKEHVNVNICEVNKNVNLKICEVNDGKNRAVAVENPVNWISSENCPFGSLPKLCIRHNSTDPSLRKRPMQSSIQLLSLICYFEMFGSWLKQTTRTLRFLRLPSQPKCDDSSFHCKNLTSSIFISKERIT